MKVELTTAYEAFGRFMTVADVEDAVPLILLLDGPKEGWVYDVRSHWEGKPSEGIQFDTLTYEPCGELYRADDDRLLRGYRLGQTP